ncbi:MAG: aldo/keto reductase [Candidatus Latescibacterota bacterium]
MKQVQLGQTGLFVSELGIGTGTNGWDGCSNQTQMGFERLVRLLRYAYGHGITFWDTADMYGSHAHVAAAMKGIDRASVVIGTKTVAHSQSEAELALHRFCQELETDVLDIVLLHGLTEGNWPECYAGAMETLSRAREQGLVRAVGVSVHGLLALRAAVASPWVEVVQVRLNCDGMLMDGTHEEVLPLVKQLRASGKGVYAMKVLGRGALGDQAHRALRYVLDLPEVDAAVVGMMTEAEVRDNVGYSGGCVAKFHAC